MSVFWNWLSGKKTVIGSIFLWLAAVLPGLFQSFGFDPTWLAQLISVLTWIGGFLVPVGVAHKAVKVSE